MDEAVVDTNVLLDWLVFGNPQVKCLVQAMSCGRVQWVSTLAMLAELRHVLGRPLGDRWDSARKLALDERLPGLQPRLVEPMAPLSPTLRLHCSDADDQMFIDLAVSRHARWLLTRDRALLRLAPRARHLGVTVVPPQSFVNS